MSDVVTDSSDRTSRRKSCVPLCVSNFSTTRPPAAGWPAGPIRCGRSERLASAAHSCGGGDIAGSHANRFEPRRRVSAFSTRRPPATAHASSTFCCGRATPGVMRSRSLASTRERTSAGRSGCTGARAAEQRGDLEAAADAYRHAIELNAGIAENYSRLGRIEEKLGRSEQAKANFEKASLVTEARTARSAHTFEEYLNATSRATIDVGTHGNAIGQLVASCRWLGWEREAEAWSILNPKR